MGYSLSVKFKNEKEQSSVYQFFISNKDIIESLSIAEGRHDVQDFIDLSWDDNLSYAPKVKYLLGYDGPSGRPYYLELFLAWMSVKSTYRDQSREPFIYYDQEKIKIQKNNSLFIHVSDNGIQNLQTSLSLFKNNKSLSFILYGVTDIEQYFQKVEVLFTILENRWQKFILVDKIKNKL